MNPRESPSIHFPYSQWLINLPLQLSDLTSINLNLIYKIHRPNETNKGSSSRHSPRCIPLENCLLFRLTNQSIDKFDFLVVREIVRSSRQTAWTEDFQKRQKEKNEICQWIDRSGRLELIQKISGLTCVLTWNKERKNESLGTWVELRDSREEKEEGARASVEHTYAGLAVWFVGTDRTPIDSARLRKFVLRKVITRLPDSRLRKLTACTLITKMGPSFRASSGGARVPHSAFRSFPLPLTVLKYFHTA